MKKIVYLILVIIWMIIIFYFSSMKSSDSDKQSDKVIESSVIKIVCFFKKDLTEQEKYDIYRYSIYPVRKYAHVFEYLVLFVLVFLYISCYDIKLSKILLYSLGICFLYSISDEIHQYFVPGRSASLKDVFIDAFGSCIGLFLCFVMKRKCKVE